MVGFSLAPQGLHTTLYMSNKKEKHREQQKREQQQSALLHQCARLCQLKVLKKNTQRKKTPPPHKTVQLGVF